MTEPLDPLDAIQLQGLAWIDRMLSGEATTADLEAMRCWRSLSPRHAAALAYAARVRRAVAAAAPGFRDAPRPAIRPLASRRMLIGAAMAASAAGYMVVRPPMGLWPSLAEMFADYQTRVGERRRVALRDGVVLDLNTQTSLALRGNAGGRQAELLGGEALATVDVPKGRRFVLAAANGRISADRASFDVRRTAAGVSVTCVSGRTDVACGAQAASLTAGQRVDYAATGLGAIVEASAEIATAWRDGLIIFHDQPVSEVIDNVNRYRAQKIMVINAALGRERISGSLHLARLDEIVAQLRLNGAQVTTLPGGAIVLS